MTRETKVGLAVASSFISLVAIVVATKFYGNDPQTAQVVTPDEPSAVAEEQPRHKEGHKKDGRGRDESERQQEKPMQELAPAVFQPNGPVGEVKPDDRNPPPLPPPGIPTPGSDRLPIEPPPGFDRDQKKTLAQLKEQVGKDPPPGADPSRLPFPETGDGGLNNNTPPAPIAPPGPVAPAPVAPAPMAPAPAPPSPTLPMGDPPPPLPTPVPTPVPSDPPGVGNVTIKPSLPPPPVDPPLPGPGTDPVPPVPMTPAPAPPPPGPSNPPNVPVPQVAPVPSKNYDTPMPPPAPIGANPGPIGQPMGIAPPASAGARVKSFAVQPYECKPEDTSFGAVSKQVFGTDRYSQALLQFNRDYPNADKGIYQNPPVLKAGQKVHIPTVDFLDAHYGSVIGGNPNPPANGANPPPPLGSGNGSGPPPIGVFVQPGSIAPPPPTIPNNAAAPPLSVPMPRPPALQPVASNVPPTPYTPSTDAVKRYRVPDQGQHILEIAQKTLGDRGRWSEIYRLNPSLQPQFPIPGGTELKLPGNAAVP